MIAKSSFRLFAMLLSVAAIAAPARLQGAAPAIVTQPQSLSVATAATASFQVAATGDAPLRYRWRFKGNALAGATNSTLTVAGVTLFNGGTYDVVITNTAGAITSQVATLTVDASLVFRVLALRTNGFIAQEVNTITGDDRGGMAVSPSRVFLTGDSRTGRWGSEFLEGGAALATYYDSLVTDLSTEKVYVLVGASGPLVNGGTDNVAVGLRELDGVTGGLTGEPITLSSTIAINYGTGFFSGRGRVVLHSGSRVYDIRLPSGVVSDLGAMNTPSHQYSENWGYWGLAEYFGNALHLVYALNEYPVRNIVRTRVPDGQAQVVAQFESLSDLASFTFSTSLSRWYFHYESSGQFFNGDEVLGSAKALYTTDPGFPTIERTPASQTNFPGSNVVFSVIATGTAPLNYQWRFNGSDIPAATNTTLLVTNLDAAAAGGYTVVVRNPAGEAESPPATLTVHTAPVIVYQPFDNSTYPGYSAYFSVTVSGPPPLEFQWRFNGLNLPQATNAVLVLTNVQPGDAGNYSVEVRNSYGSVVSSPGELTVISTPYFYQQPQGQSVVAGTNATFVVSADGAPPLRYQWLFNGAPIDGATNRLLLLTNVTGAAAGFYACAVSNAYGGVVSTNAQLSVLTLVDDGSVFRITALLTNGSKVIDHDALTGDDRGPIAISTNQVFYTGDNSTARFSAADLTGGVALNRRLDSLVSNLRTERVYLLGNGANIINGVGTNVTSLLELDGGTANLTGRRINLSAPVPLGSGQSGNVGLFSGYDRIVIYNGLSVYNIDLPSGEVSDLGTLSYLPHSYTETWAFWGVAEHSAGFINLVAVSGSQTIYRTRMPGNVTTVVTNFFNLSDMAAFTVSVPRQRWYFHYEGSAQFGGTSETLGYANATFVVNSGSKANHFEWSSIEPWQVSGSPIPITLTARTTSGGVVTNYQGVVTLRGFNPANGQTVAITPLLISNFVSGVWTGAITVTLPATNLVVRADDGNGTTGNSTNFAANPLNDLIVAATDSPDPVVAGNPLSYFILVTNTGPLSATAVVVSNQFPAGVSFVSAVASQGTCINLGAAVRCDLGAIASAATLQVTVIPSSGGTLTNRFSVTRGEADANPANNAVALTTTVILTPISIGDLTVTEGDSGTNTAFVPMWLAQPSANTVNVLFDTANGSARSSGTFPDFVGWSGAVVFPPGVTTQLVAIGIRGDIAYETNEVFFINLRSPTNGTIVRAQGACTIIDNDPVPTAVIGDATIVEGNTNYLNLNFPVVLSGPSAILVVIPFATANVTAAAEGDFQSRVGNVAWSSGTLILTQNIAIRVYGDALPEPDETFYVNLGNPTNAVLGRARATGTIVNDDALGELHHFAWNAISSPQTTGIPVPVALSARDVSGNLISNFTGTTLFTGWSNGPALATNLFGELTFSNIVNGDYTLGYAIRPTVDLRVTQVRSYEGTKVTLWTDTGTPVVTRAVSGPSGQWTETPLDVPVTLFAGQRYRVAYYTAGGGAYMRGVIETNYTHLDIESGYYTDGDAFPTTELSPGWAVDFNFLVAGPSVRFTVTPMNSGNFVQGAWTGFITLPLAASNIVLRAEDGDGHTGDSEPFVLLAGGGDRDGDGLPDDWETANQFNPDDPTDATQDADGDGQDNRTEHLAGTNPRQATSVTRLQRIDWHGDHVVLGFQGAQGRWYRLEHANQPGGNWAMVHDFLLLESSALDLHITVPAGTSSGFYRVRLLE